VEAPRTSVRDRLRIVFSETLDLDSSVDVDTLRYRADAQWESLDHMALVVAIESEFDVQFDVDNVLGLESFEDALTILRKLGVHG
jgi:acyl carrier protein